MKTIPYAWVRVGEMVRWEGRYFPVVRKPFQQDGKLMTTIRNTMLGVRQTVPCAQCEKAH